MRNKVWIHVPKSQILPGDILKLEAGNKVNADGILIESHNLVCEEINYQRQKTRERKKFWVTVSKGLIDTGKDGFVIKSSRVVQGVGQMLVVSAGKDQEESQQHFNLLKNHEDCKNSISLSSRFPGFRRIMRTSYNEQLGNIFKSLAKWIQRGLLLPDLPPSWY